MDHDTTDAAWHELELCQRRFEEEQALLRADPAFGLWLAFVEASASFEPIEQELNHGDHCIR